MSDIRIVLVCPSHPGNIGSVARAMKTMGLHELVLVNPEDYPSGQARATAVSAVDILDSARVVGSLAEALEGCHAVYGTSARERSLEKPLVTPRSCAPELISAGKVAILFGRERSGLTNEELSLCHKHIRIPTSDQFSSLNLAASVQIIAYECLVAAQQPVVAVPASESRPLATADQVVGFYDHLQQTLTDIGFIDPKQPKQLMQRLRRLFNRASIDQTELNILRGILSQVDWLVKRSA